MRGIIEGMNKCLHHLVNIISVVIILITLQYLFGIVTPLWYTCPAGGLYGHLSGRRGLQLNLSSIFLISSLWPLSILFFGGRWILRRFGFFQINVGDLVVFKKHPDYGPGIVATKILTKPKLYTYTVTFSDYAIIDVQPNDITKL